MARKLAITKRISLAEFSEDWKDCYAIIRPATYSEAKVFRDTNVKSLDEDAKVDLELKMIGQHLVSGKIRAYNDANQPELVDLDTEDLRDSMPIANHIFYEILGIASDPKGSPTATTTS
jgi:hypothetical protein